MSRTSRLDLAGLTTVRTVGALVPADLLARIIAGKDLPGLSADDYRLELGVTPREAANRAWSVLTGAWTAYRDALAARPEGDRATGLTRDKWLAVLLRELGFGRVPPTPAGGLHADDRSFPVSHVWGEVPIHLLGWSVDLDRRTPGVAGAAERAPHAMVQELLNRSDEFLWALLANGRTLRLLRDSSSLVGQSYVEFDLEAMFEGDVFSDFAVLFLLCHQTRFEPVDSEAGPEDCWLERWRSDAVETGARALGALRVGVQRAIEALGTGFLQHPANAELRDRIDTDLTLADYHRALLRLVYRLLFCFVAEDRGLLLDPAADAVSRERYADWFSTARLRRIATRRRGTRHADLWQALSIVIDGLGRDGGRPELGLPGIGGLFEHGPADVFSGQQLGNDALLSALRHLCVIQPPGGGPKRTVDYRNLGAEELGGIYESLLEFVPRYDPIQRSFTLESLVGNERKTSGAYYTPTSLIDCLLDSALDPLLDEAEAAGDPESALLALTVCDPACGSGHFLVAAARRIAARLARVRADGGEPTVLDAQAAMHDVVGRCIYGVDLNPMAAELAKVSLWLEALQPGRPLSFLDAHIRVGNALLGTTPALLAAGIPDSAFAPLEGDDKRLVSSLRKQNQREHAGHDNLFGAGGIPVGNVALAEAVAAIDAAPSLSLADVALAQRRQRELETSPELGRARLVADAWCAAFVVAKRAGTPEITQATLVRLSGADPAALAQDRARAEVERLAATFRFFHWHLEFPRIFTTPGPGPASTGTGWAGGFSCVVGNPPWDQVQLDAREFFATREPAISSLPNHAARQRAIAALATTHPALYHDFVDAQRHNDAFKHLTHASGRFPLTSYGRLNTSSLFAEHFRSIVSDTGRAGLVLPTGIATDAFNQHFFRDLVVRRSLVSLYDFENAKPLFDGVHRSFKFCLLALAGPASPVDAADFAFFAHDPGDLARPGARFALTPDEILLLNPNTATCPVFRRRRDAEITLAIYRRVPLLVRHGDVDGNPWDLSFMLMFMMNTDSHRFRTAAQLVEEGWKLDGNVFRHGDDLMLPLYEAKMVHHFDHRWATYGSDDKARDVTPAEHDDPDFVVQPRYWLASSEVDAKLAGRWHQGWFAGWRRVARSTDVRTLIASCTPRLPTTDKLVLNFTDWSPAPLIAMYSSLALDYVARQKAAGTQVDYFLAKQLPVLPPSRFLDGAPWQSTTTVGDWIRLRVLELTFTAWDMEPFARDLVDDGPPFRWDDDRRALLRAELDGAFFHLYGVERGDVDYILGTFPIVNRNDVKRHGEERTRILVLDAYDRLATATASGQPFLSTLDPPPGDGARHPGR